MALSINHPVILILLTLFGIVASQGNSAPEWDENLLEALSTAGVSEDTLVNAVLGTLRATDPDGDSITYSTNTPVVEVNPSTGRVTLARELDYEVATLEQVRFFARDTSGLTTEAEYTMSVLDIQDSPPVFENAPVTIDLDENTGNNVLLDAQLLVRDGDMGVPHDLSISITEDSRGLFRLDTPAVNGNKRYTVGIRTADVIDREEIGSSYSFTVTAQEIENGVETGVSAETVVTVTINDINDSGPRFSQNVYDVTVREGLLRAAQIPGLAMFVTDGDTGDNAYFELQIRDVASNRFPSPKSEIYTISPTSGTSSASVTLSVNDTAYFDYEVPNYRVHVFEVVATETRTTEQRSGSAMVYINLRDENDNFPIFERTQYVNSVREDRDVGHLVDTITATDADSAPFNQITYSLTGTGSDSFEVNPTSGEITLAKKLDFEESAIFELEYNADDNAGRVSQVRFVVNVLDFNDQGPVFSADEYETFVGETTIELQPPITVSAADLDSDLPVTYRILTGNELGIFNLDPDSGELTLTRPVSFSETPDRLGVFNLEVEASDNDDPTPQTSTALVIVDVRDENDHAPQFGSATYFGQVRETTPPGTLVVTVEADDLDANLNAKIDFIIQSGSIDNFVVDIDSGEITIAPNANLDIETNGAEYEMLVHAVDRGSPPMTGTATVYVTVIDSNNKDPYFGQDFYLVTVPEDTEVDTVVETITAIDPDSSANLRYRIQDGTISAQNPAGEPVTDTDIFDYLNAFTVDPTSGEVSTALPLDHDLVNLVNFTMLVEDMNAEDPSPQTGTAIVEISILRTGGTEVTFPPPWSSDRPEYTIHVPEEELPDSVITQLVATDPVTSSAITDYREVPGTDPNNYFGIRGNTGQVYVNRRLDYETLPQNELTFQVVAYTQGPEVRSAAATLRIIIDDINDNSPQFTQGLYNTTVPEGAESGVLVAFPRAFDEDSGNFSSITYSLSGPGSEMFHIDPDTGDVQVAPNVTLDREGISLYNLLVTACDGNGGDDGRCTSVPFIIVLDDENDNAPIFTRDPFEIYTPDKREPNKILGQVTARDADAGNNGKVVYTMIAGDTDLFFVQSNGTIRSNKHPSLEGFASVAPYELTVRAQDSGAIPQYSDVTVFIYVQDSQTQGGAPVINFPSSDGDVITVDEEVEPGTNVTQIDASSNDPNNVLTFTFVINDELESDASHFDIDPDTGLITVRDRLDREFNSRYQLIIMVTDSNGQETVRRIFIDLNDINDNMPSFDCPGSPKVDPIVAYVMENINNTRVVQVQACDSDGPESVIYYEIIGGNELDTVLGDVQPFRINEFGVIHNSVPLDREHNDLYTLVVQAKNLMEDEDEEETANVTSRRKRQSGGRNDVVTVIVRVEDENDNPPRFDGENGASGGELVAGVLMTARPGTDIITVRAADSDESLDTDYSLVGQEFIDHDNDIKSTPFAFIIHQKTGVVETNLEEYIKYVDGYFQMQVKATDGRGRSAQATLSIYVVRETQRLRFVIDQDPDDTMLIQDELLDEVRTHFPDMSINGDTLHYHSRRNGKVDFHRSDLCFYVIKDGIVVNVDKALDRFEVRERGNADLREAYEEYKVTRVDPCQIKMTTRWWSGWWWLWWILIFFAVFIFVAALICIIFICCCWPRYLKYSDRTQPYKVLKMVEPTSSLPPASEIEWQEEVIKMQ